MTQKNIDDRYAVFDTPAGRNINQRLAEQGKTVAILPFAEIRCTDKDISPLLAPGVFDWLIVSDIFAADCFLNQIERSGMDPGILDEKLILAAGESVADRLRSRQVHSDIIAQNIDPASIIGRLADYAGGDLSGLVFLLIDACDFDTELVNMIPKHDGSVTIHSAYELYFSDKMSATKAKALIAGGAVTEVIFASPEEVIMFLALIRGNKIRHDLEGIRITAVDEITFRTLSENGLRPLYSQNK